MFQKFKNNFAFTLIEIMVVIVIIGIVAGVITLRNQGAVDQSKLSKAKAFATSIPVNLSGNYVASWKLDQIDVPSTNQTPDSWGAHDCTLGYSGSYSLPSLQTSGCVFDSCLQFAAASGTGNYISCPDDSELQLTRYYTIEFWIYRSSDVGATERIISRTTSSAAGTYDLWVQVVTTDQIQTGLLKNSAGDWVNLTGNTALGLSQWYHVVVSKDASNFYIYLNGVLDKSGIGSGSMGDARVTTGNAFNIGRLGSAGTWYYGFNGKLDDIRVYNYTFQVGEIKNHYLVGLEKLLESGQITEAEYASRLNELNQNLANNK